MKVITGATGKLGRLVVDALLQKVPAHELAVAVRSPERAADFAARGVSVRQADYRDPASLRAALAGADQVLLISSSEVGSRLIQHQAVIAAAQAVGVGLLAYTSILHADTSPLLLATEHRATEEAIRASSLPFVLLRNSWYTENYTDRLSTLLAVGAVIGSAGTGRIAAAARADYAAAAAAVLTGTGHHNKIYELAGDASFTLAELAAELSRQTGQTIPYRDIPAEKQRELLIGAGLPAPYADIFVDADLGIARGALDDDSGDLRRLIGRATTPLSASVATAVRELASGAQTPRSAH